MRSHENEYRVMQKRSVACLGREMLAEVHEVVPLQTVPASSCARTLRNKAAVVEGFGGGRRTQRTRQLYCTNKVSYAIS